VCDLTVRFRGGFRSVILCNLAEASEASAFSNWNSSTPEFGFFAPGRVIASNIPGEIPFEIPDSHAEPSRAALGKRRLRRLFAKGSACRSKASASRKTKETALKRPPFLT
jgi:hypothetical protein